MSNIITLNSNDFRIENGLLKLDVNGFMLVMFYSDSCGYCVELKPIFKKLSRKFNMMFPLGMIKPNTDLVRKSEKTTTKIAYYPMIVMYVNGMPISVYSGNNSEKSIMQFVLNSLGKL